jgi:hypothetical protein
MSIIFSQQEYAQYHLITEEESIQPWLLSLKRISNNTILDRERLLDKLVER